jgi:hypothetical protein
MNTDALTALRINARTKAAALPVWRAPLLIDLHPGRVLAFDQSLAACGVAVLTFDGQTLFLRDAHVMQVPATDAKRSREHGLRRAELLVDAIINWYQRSVPDDQWSVVYEAVPEGGSIHAPESSLLGAMAVRMATRTFRGAPPLLDPVPAQSHKKFVCGNRNATKKEHHAALMELTRALGVRGAELLTNEGKRDAFSVGLYALAQSHG